MDKLKQIEQIDAHTFRFTLDADFAFQHGGHINPLTLVYETHGQLNARKDNVVVIIHALSPSHHVTSHPANTKAGWWEKMVGPGKALDSEKFFIICINNLASCFGSSSPLSINPKTDQPHASTFPTTTIEDIARSQHLLLEYLGIKKVFALIGNSMAGMIALSWAIKYPHEIENLLCVSSCYKAYAANIANRQVQREIIQLDPAWQQGNYQQNPTKGLALARKLGHFTYRSPQALNDKFKDANKIDINTPSDVENYLNYNANKFAENFDANCYLYFLNAMDLFNVCRTQNDPTAVFRRITARVLIVAVDSDILYLPQQQQDLFAKLQQANDETQFITHHSTHGHDAFLIDTEEFGRYFQNFLAL